jgi:hypothetical protein
LSKLHSARQSEEVYDPNACPFGIGYKEWTILWWKWLISITGNDNPAFDRTGRLSSISQNNPNVWFLAGTFGGHTIRKLTVPQGKAILFPIINYESSFADDSSIRTEKELEERCKLEIDKIGDISATLDGNAIDIQKHRVQSGIFSVYLPRQNCICSVDGMTRMASDGYWLFLKPPSRGNHVLTSYGSCLAGKIQVGCTFRICVK